MDRKGFLTMLAVLIFSVFWAGGDGASGGPEPVLETASGKVLCFEGGSGNGLVYAGTEKGLYASGDGGKTWSRIDISGGNIAVKRIALAEEAIYLATDRGLYKGDTGKADWGRLPGRKTADGVAVCDSAVYVWSGEELFIMSDRGLDKIKSGMIWGEIRDVVCAGGCLYLVSCGRVYYSGDNGRSWGRISLILSGDEEEDGEEDVAADEEGFEAPGISDIEDMGNGDIAVGTRKGIFVLKGSVIKERIDTGGLPSARLRYIACGKGMLAAATDKDVFMYPDKSGVWRRIFKPAFPGTISFMGFYPDPREGEMLFVAAGNYLYRYGVDPAGEVKHARVEDNMPSVIDVQRMAIEYAEVSPEKIKEWREGAKWKAVFPKLSLSYSESFDDNIEIYKSSSSYYIVDGPREMGNDWKVGLAWDLSDLVWNNAQTSIDVRSKLMVQLRDDILEEVTRLYFERKRSLAEIRGESDIKKELRVEELTAYIDALTGGRFSAALKGDK